MPAIPHTRSTLLLPCPTDLRRLPPMDPSTDAAPYGSETGERKRRSQKIFSSPEELTTYATASQAQKSISCGGSREERAWMIYGEFFQDRKLKDKDDYGTAGRLLFAHGQCIGEKSTKGVTRQQQGRSEDLTCAPWTALILRKSTNPSIVHSTTKNRLRKRWDTRHSCPGRPTKELTLRAKQIKRHASL